MQVNMLRTNNLIVSQVKVQPLINSPYTSTSHERLPGGTFSIPLSIGDGTPCDLRWPMGRTDASRLPGGPTLGVVICRPEAQAGVIYVAKE